MVSAVLKRGAVTIQGAVPIRGNTVFINMVISSSYNSNREVMICADGLYIVVFVNNGFQIVR